MRPVFRFAPSPNGPLHLGHAFSALVGFEMAAACQGRFLLRIEDIDKGRSRDEFVTGIFEDLAWLGLTWEEPVLRQSEHFAAYRRASQTLVDMGLLYPCFASRTEVAQAAHASGLGTDPDGSPIYPGLHKHLSAPEIRRRKDAGEPFALRLHMSRALALARAKLKGKPMTFVETGAYAQGQEIVVEAHPERWGDAVIARKDIPTSYALSVVVDDARQGVSHVTRGLDLFAATDLQRLLQILLDLPEPIYHHHRLLTDVAGRKLSKSAFDTSLRSLRDAGTTPAAIRTLIGLTP
jgi:glutamyl-Q tRNA(Asp) synthetase